MVLIVITSVILSLTVHEYCHALVAFKLGDNTPRECNRLVLNPFAHVDILGTIIIPFTLLSISRGMFFLGYAKPIPLNPYYFKNPKKGIMWTALAGPAANIVIAAFVLLILKIAAPFFLRDVLFQVAFTNIMLAIISFLPLPPFDGSKIAAAMMPYRLSYHYLRLEPLGLVAVFILAVSGALKWLIAGLETGLLNFLV